MRAWPSHDVPTLPVKGPEVQVYDSSKRALVTVTPSGTDDVARMYVCGITPYDATHLGHASTYLAFDLLNRAWRSAGHQVRYVQNVTDVDDPLLERATATGVDWRELAERETELFRTDMAALRVLPPDAYIGAVEAIDLVVDMIEDLQAKGTVYEVDNDLYFSVHAAPGFGDVSGWDRDEMLRIFPQRGGDPDRVGKKDALDCLLWQGERPDDPSWPSRLGPGRPGWHIECAAIARANLGGPLDVQGGGSDLLFPHHEMSAAEAEVVDERPFAQAYVHAGMVGLDGEKMSKSKGNLVLVSTLRTSGVDPMAIRLAVLNHHYRSDWEWTSEDLNVAEGRLSTWHRALALPAGPPAAEVVSRVLAALAEDLDAPRAIAFIHDWASQALDGQGDDTDAPAQIKQVLDAALGIKI